MSIEIKQLDRNHNLSNFHCGDSEDSKDLSEFLKTDALNHMDKNTSRTYVALDDNEVIGYVSILTDSIRITSEERSVFRINEFETFPAIKIGKLAVSSKCQSMGIGKMLIKYVYDLTINILIEHIGCIFLTIDSLAQAESYYSKLGFIRNLHKNYRNKNTISFRMDMFSSTLPDWLI